MLEKKKQVSTLIKMPKMKDKEKTQEQLKSELEVLRQRVVELEGLKVEHKQAEHALRESEHSFRELFDTMTSGVAVYEVKNNGNKFIFKDFNKAAERITGIKRDQVVGKNAEKVFPGLKDAGLIGAFQQVWETGKATHHPLSLYQDKRIDFWVENNLYKLQSGQVVAIFDDITDRKRAEETIRESDATLSSIFRAAPTGIGMVKNRIIKKVNEQLCKMIGYSRDELLEQSARMLYPSKEEFQRVGEEKYTMIQESGTGTIETRWKRKDGTEIDVLLSSTPLDPSDLSKGVTFTALDITERKRLETQLLQAQKMEAIGTLASGIAHDFNNILGAIFGYAELAQMNLSENNTIKGYIEQILAASDRAKGLVRQILAFSRQSKPEKIPVDIGIVVKEALKLLRASLPANIEIRKNVKSNQGSVMADQTQIHQVMMNLCTNALHAMEKKGGLLGVTLAPVELNKDEAVAYHDLKPGRYLKLTVTDSGYGMDSATLARIFEPYFTTKEVGEGTGMGLSTVHGIVQDHNGAIKVYSEPGVGTSFHILLPYIEVEAKETETIKPLPTGTEQVLFVDDEKVLVDIGEKMLKKLGYKVKGRTSPYEALEAFRANPDKFDLVITDMTMPIMSGENLAKEILKIRSDMPVIICTGFSNMITPENASSKGIKDFLMKPFTMHDLSKSIRKVLDQSGSMIVNERL